jgi:hypothetical protein
MSNGNSDVLIASLDIHKKVHYAHCELEFLLRKESFH